jgi:DNA-binding NtrC family response regulator
VLRETGHLDVLIVEDSETDTKLVIRELSSSGLSPSYVRVDTPAALREALTHKSWQLVISDSSVPGLGVHQALAMARELAPRTPFVVVSGNDSEEQAVQAMRAGAADYVAKNQLRRLGPVVLRELSEARIRESPSQWLIATQEGRHVARALHDDLGQLLTALKVNAAAQRLRPTGDR